MLDFGALVKEALPTFKRKTRYLALLQAIARPLATLNQTFAAYRTQSLYRLRFSGQTIYLEHYLNDLYDPTSRQIYIENLEREFVYVYNRAEGVDPEHLFNLGEVDALPLYLKNVAEIDLSDAFIVWVPDYVTYDETQIRAQIDQYRASGRNYSIQTYTP